MSNQTTHLFDLIKALTPAEKKIVMKYAFPYKKGGDSSLRQLFTAIDKQTTYNETVLRQKIKNLPSRKLELWKKIMLLLQSNNSTIEIVKARRKFDFIHILASKQLFQQIPDMLEELKQWSIKHNQLFYEGIAMQYESALLQAMHKENYLKYLPAVRMQTLEIAEKILLTAQVFEFYARVNEVDRSQHITRTKRQALLAKKLQVDPLAKLSTEKMSLQSIGTYNDALSTLWYLQGQFDRAYYYENLTRLAFRNVGTKTPIDIYNYCSWLTNQMSLHDRLKDYELWQQDIEELTRVVNTHFANDHIRVSKSKMLTFWFQYRSGQLKANSPLLAETEKYYTTHKHLLAEEDVKYHEWNFILAFFGLGLFDKSWHYCHELTGNTSPETMPEIQEFMSLFFLFIILEKRDWLYLKNRIKQYEKKTKGKSKTQYAFDFTIIEFMKNMIASKEWKGEQVKHWKALHQSMCALRKNKNTYTVGALHLFDFIHWIERKIT